MKDQGPIFDFLRRAEDTARRHSARRIERVERPSASFIRNAMAASQPVLITGAAHDWKIPTWTPADLKTAYGEVPISIERSGGEYKLVLSTVGALVDLLKTSERVYTTCALPAPLVSAFDAPTYLPWEQLTEPILWLGCAGHLTALHRDLRHGFSVQVFGSKRWKMYSPDQVEYIYARPSVRGFQGCLVDAEKPDLAAFPAFKNAVAMEIILNPGEVLLTPSGWFHSVTSLESALSVAYSVIQSDDPLGRPFRKRTD